MSKPTVGRFVHYVLTEQDADQINTRRSAASANLAIKDDPTGYIAHVGNKAEAGQVFPLLITRVWSDTCVNGQLFLDGNDTLWKTSASKATDDLSAEGRWTWPERV